MSKKDIQTVCELSAHLSSMRIATHEIASPGWAPRCAADAMALQRLAQNIRHKARDIQRMAWGIYLRGMTEKAETVLKPYGLVAELDATGIHILGLPGNTMGGDESGFAI